MTPPSEINRQKSGHLYGEETTDLNVNKKDQKNNLEFLPLVDPKSPSKFQPTFDSDPTIFSMQKFQQNYNYNLQ